MIEQSVIDKIINYVDIVAEIGSDVQLKKKGVNYEGCCPFHNERTPSFKVSPTKGIFMCFGCNEGGNVIQYIQKRDNMTFPEAVEFLARKHNIEYEKYEPTPEEREKGFKRERIFTINKVALDYFLASYRNSEGAQKYALSRWKTSTIEGQQIGYAPKQWQGFIDYARKLGYQDDVMIDAGLIREKEGHRYDAFVDRLMFPIRNRVGNIIGFTGRSMDSTDKKIAKYINTEDTLVFKKKENLFGMFEAIKETARKGRINLVEGAPDVIRLFERGVTNTVAPLGTALTADHIAMIKSVAKSVVIIGDTDNAGINAVLKNGEALFRSGLNVSVMTILDGKSKDPDEFFKEIHNSYDECLSSITHDFIHCLVSAKLADSTAAADRVHIIESICDILCDCPDESIVNVYIEQLGKDFKPKSAWTSKIAEKRNTRQMDARKKSNNYNEELLKKFGFTVENNSYWAFGKSGNVKWSNFVMKPLAHIRSMTNAKRLYVITNEFNDEQTIELKQEDLVSLMKFRIKVESMGNYIWEASEMELHKLKRYLYDKTETCDEIMQLGWQKRYNFYAWGNGGFFDDKFVKVDDIGILRINGGAYYMPAFSKIFRNEIQLFQFERKFVHAQGNGISLQDYTEKLVTVFGNNAKVAICFLIATLFKDVVTSHTKSFPILNLFGPKGTGKSELGHSLSAFFVIDNTPPNINNTTIAALAESVAQVSNAVVHIDEYKNSLDIDKIEFLKGLWDGAGRTRMNMDRDKKRETTVVDAGVVLSGQEMPTADIALFSRLLFLTFYRTEYSDQEKRDFEELKRIEHRGLSHLTNQILSFRRKFEIDFRACWDYAAADLSAKLSSYTIEDRTLKNWLTVVSAFRCLENELHLPFTYKEVLNIATEGIIEQNNKTKQNNELSGFWETVENLVRSAVMWVEVDYKIKYQTRPITMLGCTEQVQLDPQKQYLFIGFNRIASLYMKDGKISGDKKIPKDSLKYYLEHSREFKGTAKAVKFKNISSSNGYVEEKVDNFGKIISKTTVTTAMVFDYAAIKEMYGIDINVVGSYMDDDDAEPIDMTSESKTASAPKLPF